MKVTCKEELHEQSLKELCMQRKHNDANESGENELILH
jgi:hypothetical protein